MPANAPTGARHAVLHALVEQAFVNKPRDSEVKDMDEDDKAEADGVDGVQQWCEQHRVESASLLRVVVASDGALDRAFLARAGGVALLRSALDDAPWTADVSGEALLALLRFQRDAPRWPTPQQWGQLPLAAALFACPVRASRTSAAIHKLTTKRTTELRLGCKCWCG